MESVITGLILLLVLLVFISEIYKIRFERKNESQDERGQFLIFKVKSLSYTILSAGIFIGFALVAILKVMKPEIFIYYMIIVYLFQSVASSIYLSIVRKI
ncbi:hypothetical protein [Sporosarcina sp. FSL K6-2383]|uniref:hypothetical protein n=1 Tax=Sporosarcina sp. FSL K6-2383 TaxID=2921556 RepID=UPI00315AB31C